jgi:hypothetical protein
LTGIGGVKYWGLNAIGQLGDGTFMNRNIPVNWKRYGYLIGRFIHMGVRQA